MNIRNGFTFQLSVCALFCLMANAEVLGEDQFSQPVASPFTRTRTSQVGTQAYRPQPSTPSQQNKQLLNSRQPSRTTGARGGATASQRHLQPQQVNRQANQPRTVNNIETNRGRANSVPPNAASSANLNSNAHTSLKKNLAATSYSEQPRAIGGSSSSEGEEKPTKKKSQTPTLVSPGKLLTAFTFVIFLIIVSARYWKKHLPGRGIPISNELLTVLGERRLNKNHSISLVRLGSRILVLGASADGLRTLTEITDPVEIDLLSGMAHSAQTETAFTSAFGSLMKKSKSQTSKTPATATLGAKTTPQATAASLLSSIEEMKRG